jgi:hypothetical protein
VAISKGVFQILSDEESSFGDAMKEEEYELVSNEKKL